MTKHFLAMIALVALVCTGCASDEYLGHPEDIDKHDAISFNGETGKVTRVQQGGKDAATSLNNNFVVYGYKTTDNTPQTVYDHYNVNYADGSALSTTSNTAGWEYVGQKANMLNAKLSTTEDQDIKYWDMAAGQYDFIAFSAGTATQVAANATPAAGEVAISRITTDADGQNPTYTISGATADLAKVYIADRVTAHAGAETQSNTLVRYRDAIQFAFHSLASKVRIGLYETIPGYSVTDVKFYQKPISAAGEATPYLYAGSQTIPTGTGKVTVSFPVTDKALPAYNKAKVTYDSDSPKTETLNLTTFTANAAKEQNETEDGIYLGRTASTASKSADVTLIPAPAGPLTLKVDFTLVSIDYNETIDVKGATAVIPAAFTDWQANCAYTYLFKISNGVTNSSGQVLYPITFDALEVADDLGLQQTITTVDQPSITTYAKGELGSDYFVGDNIYISVTNGTAKTLNADNAKLYTASAISADIITEKNLTDGISGITLNEVPDGFMTFTDHIDAADSSTGDQINAIADSNFAKFTAGNEIYVFEYTEGTGDDAEKHYKVIRIGDARRPLTLPDIPEEDL